MMRESLRRHDSRILALSALFCWELTKGTPGEVFDLVAEGFFSPAQKAAEGGWTEAVPRKPSLDRRLDYARGLFVAATEHAGEIDPLIAKASQGWQVSRMPRIDLSILRLAIAEVGYLKETPMEIVMDEAVELSKEFSTYASPRFVNGVLSGVLREMGHAKTQAE